MRVLLLNHFPLFGSGSGVYTLNIANSLVDAGCEVACIFPDNEIDATEYKFQTHPVYFTPENKNSNNQDLDNTAQVKSSKNASKQMHLQENQQTQKNNVQSALPFNFPCFTTHPKSSNTFENLTDVQLEQYIGAFRDKIDQVVSDFKPDIIHAGHIWILAALGCEVGLPVVVTAHGTDIIGYRQSKRYHDIAKRAAQKASAIISISKRNFEEVADTFPFAREKTILLSNGYDENRFYPEKITRKEVLARYGIEREYKKMVSFAGKFTHFKGIDILLHAAKKYEDDDTLTLLAGDGELFSDMKKLADSLSLKHVVFVGAQSPDALRSIYSVVDVSCAPSRKEPFGLVVIEAGACGAPVVGTNGGGIADILVSDTGLLVSEEDADGLAGAIKSILSKSRVFDRAHIAKYTREHFAQSQYTRKLIDEVYLRALQTSR